MRVASVIPVLALVLVGCGGGEQAASTTAVGEAIATDSAAAPPWARLVGYWDRRTTCGQRVQALREAGLGDYAAEHAAGEGWVRRVDDPRHPCREAVPLRHGHFFTDDGLFGSTDDEGQQVDDGTYRLVDADTIVISKEFGEVTFDFHVRGDRLYLDPVLPSCVEDGCFAAQWAVAVAAPGRPWHRAE